MLVRHGPFGCLGGWVVIEMLLVRGLSRRVAYFGSWVGVVVAWPFRAVRLPALACAGAPPEAIYGLNVRGGKARQGKDFLIS